ncbi:hypothetical protein NOC27_1097 [Nitrosococcus oceani AFC27]|nr:hypothetical protein NOC27_1097 [Nitrosococcus oceani AFC27]
MAEWLCSGLQSRGRRFDSDPSLHFDHFDSFSSLYMVLKECKFL